MFAKILSVFIGGGVGTLLRYSVTMLSRKYLSTPIAGTFLVNIVGCLLIGYVIGSISDKSESLKLLITVGLLGGLTTFSTFNLEVFELIKAGKPLFGISYMFLSCMTGLLFTYIGYTVSSNS